MNLLKSWSQCAIAAVLVALVTFPSGCAQPTSTPGTKSGGSKAVKNAGSSSTTGGGVAVPGEAAAGAVETPAKPEMTAEEKKPEPPKEEPKPVEEKKPEPPKEEPKPVEEKKPEPPKEEPKPVEEKKPEPPAKPE